MLLMRQPGADSPRRHPEKPQSRQAPGSLPIQTFVHQEPGELEDSQNPPLLEVRALPDIVSSTTRSTGLGGRVPRRMDG